MKSKEPLAQMSDMWRDRCHKAERDRDLARRDYECMNKFREAAETERDQLREALEKVESMDSLQGHLMKRIARAALAATEEKTQ